jgi:hypothetical protein
MLKVLQYIFKFLASIFSKLGAKYTYNRLFKNLMKYKLISILYYPMNFILSNIIYFIKLASAIIAILSLFNLSLLYYDFAIIDETTKWINEVLTYIKFLINK